MQDILFEVEGRNRFPLLYGFDNIYHVLGIEALGQPIEQRGCQQQEFAANNILESNGVRIDLLNKSAVVNETPIELTKSEYELLLFFIGNKDRVISKSAMAEHLSGEMADMMDNYDFVYTHIKNLKAKLAAAGCKDYIKNVYGTGYKWTEL